MKTRDNYYTAMKKHPWNEQIKEAFKMPKNRATNMIRRAKREYYKKNEKFFGAKENMVNGILNHNKREGPTRIINNGNVDENPAEMSSIFNYVFIEQITSVLKTDSTTAT